MGSGQTSEEGTMGGMVNLRLSRDVMGIGRNGSSYLRINRPKALKMAVYGSCPNRSGQLPASGARDINRRARPGAALLRGFFFLAEA
jgi:hypothetical protein